MRAMWGCAFAFVAVALAYAPSTTAQQGGCGPNALGVSRVVEIDASGGPRFGQQQYNDNDLLKDGEIALTFDDGPLRPYTQPVLAALAQHCSKATFFMVGRMAVADPEMVREVARHGHTIGTHTWSHQNMRAMLPHRAKMEIELGFSAVRRALGEPIAPFFRFPYLADSRAMTAHLQTRNLAIFSIDADGYDYRTQNGADVHRAIVSQLMVKRKGIILFHDIQPSTARALKGLLDDLKGKGFKVVHFVPKVTATTIAEYDTMAAKEIGDKRLAAASQPLANRSLVWTAHSAKAASGPQPYLAGPPPAVQPAPLPPVQPRVPRPAPEADWRDRIFSR